MTWMWTSSCPHFIMMSESWRSNNEGLPYHDLLKLLSGNRTSHLWNECLWFLISDLISSLQPMRDFDFIVFFPEYVIYTNPVRCRKRRTTLALCFPCYFSITILRLFKKKKKSLFCACHETKFVFNQPHAVKSIWDWHVGLLAVWNMLITKTDMLIEI